jgi:hypothetical protein
MAAVTAPPYSYPAPPPGPPPEQPPGPPQTGRRRWLPGLAGAWVVVIAVLGWWSVRSDPPTVPEQRDIADALPVLQRATGALLAAAAAGDDRAVVLGELRLSRDCNLTPMRGGIEATRDVTLHVAADRALPVLRQVAAALPPAYAARAADSSGGRRVGLQADAGGFVAIDAVADSGAQVVQVTVSTGCRPRSDGVDLPAAGPSVEDGPPALRAALAALAGDGPARLTEVACPDGGTGRTYTVDGVPAPRDLGRSLQGVVAGATVLRAEPAGWAYRAGADSVVVVRNGETLRVSVTTPCA